MEPVTLATVTAALTLLGTECAKGIASQVGKDIWTKAKNLFGWTEEPKPAELPQTIATRLQNDDVLSSQIIKLLQEAKNTDASMQMIGSLVNNLTAGKVVVAGKVEGGITF